MGTSDQMGISHTHTHTHTHTNLLPLLGQSNAWGQELLDSIDWAAAGLQGPPRLRPICSEYYTEPGCSPFAVSRTQHCNVVRGVVQDCVVVCVVVCVVSCTVLCVVLCVGL